MLPLLIIILLMAIWPPATHAAFIESFVPRPASSKSSEGAKYLPLTWEQVAKINEGGRGVNSQGSFHMTLNNDNPVAETTTLRWVKTSPSELVFYAGMEDVWDDCTDAVKLLFSTDSITWSEVWTQDLQEWSPRGYEPFRVILPVDESVGNFAVKWTYQEGGRSNCYTVNLDDITFPADKPEKRKPGGPSPAPGASPAPAAKMPAGVAPIPLPCTFQGTCTCAATYCGAAVALRNGTNTTNVSTNTIKPTIVTMTVGNTNITASNTAANTTNTTNTATNTGTSTDAAALGADNTADDATTTAADEEPADTGDAGGATADGGPAEATANGEPADTGDAGDLADTADYAATSEEEPGTSEDATNTATGPLPADAAAGSLPANGFAERGSSARLSSPGRRLKAMMFG